MDSVIWYWSTIAAQAIPALLPPLKGDEIAQRKELDHISRLFNRPVVLTTASATKQLWIHGGFEVVCVEELLVRSGYGTIPAETDPGPATEDIDVGDSTCTILFTSGSTGLSKAVELTHRQLMMSSFLKCTSNNMRSCDRFLCWICKVPRNISKIKGVSSSLKAKMLTSYR